MQTELKWKDINFFDNDFSKDVGEAFFKEMKGDLDLMSPDNTSDGWLKKKWIMQDGDRFLLKIRKNEKDTPYEHLKRCAEHFGITGYQSFLNHMLTLDYLILNTDRHYGNFGFIRNVDTLKFEGPASLFDHGTSLWNNELKVIPHYEPAKSFRSTQSKQLKLVDDFQAFPLNKFKKLGPCIADIFAQNVNLDKKRIEMLYKGIKDRIKNLERFIDKQVGLN